MLKSVSYKFPATKHRPKQRNAEHESKCVEREPFGVAKPTKRRSPSSLNLKNPRNLKITGVISILLNPFLNKILWVCPALFTPIEHTTISFLFFFFFSYMLQRRTEQAKAKNRYNADMTPSRAKALIFRMPMFTLAAVMVTAAVEAFC